MQPSRQRPCERDLVNASLLVNEILYADSPYPSILPTKVLVLIDQNLGEGTHFCISPGHSLPNLLPLFQVT